MNAFKEDYQDISEDITSPLSDQELERWPSELEEKLRSEQERIRAKHRLSHDIYLTIDEPIRESELGWWKNALAGWSSGTLSEDESSRVVSEIDQEELDEYYILMEVPNFLISGQQRGILERALVALGCGFESEWKELDDLCELLRATDRDA